LTTTQQILVIGAFTHGDEAAYQFSQQYGLGKANGNLVYCGTNVDVVKKLVHGPALAVVPVYNSIVGEIGEVVGALAEAKAAGYALVERGRLDLPINQALLAPLFVRDPRAINTVVSHRYALDQCRKYLDALSIPLNNRYPCPSTGEAAERVSQIHPHDSEHSVAAIASPRAAEHYGLRVLAEHIQDDRKAFTTFLLLEHV
jgi:chorismate mutase / prephenate dehydratase